VDDKIHFRSDQNIPPAAQMISSPYDVEVTMTSNAHVWYTGYKVHLTESCDDDRPHLITHVETTLATEADSEVVEVIHAALDTQKCLPAEHLVDSGYGSGAAFVTSQEKYAVDLFGPSRPDMSWQAQTADAFDISHFQIDFEQRLVTCPQGHLSTHWYERTDSRGKPAILVKFPDKVCRACPVRERCTTSQKGRQVGFIPEPAFSALQTARQREQTDTFKQAYRRRSGIEGTISQAVGVLGMRRTRYCGLGKVHLQHLMTAAAMNLMRVLDWLSGKQRATTRTSAFARLAMA